MEHLSVVSFLGKLLVFPVNVRLDWKAIDSTNTVAYLASLTVMKEKMFYNIDTMKVANALSESDGVPGM